jgi:Tol biopolymer transport system component/imidazolonepropionase-like amidohydrolase
MNKLTWLFATLLLAINLSPMAIFAQDKPKWDVNNPTGLSYDSVHFDVNRGTWTCSDVSPDGKTIAFDLLGDIYTMPISGGVATCLRRGIAWEVQPRFSPDGTKILYTSDAGGGDNIWVMQADGSKPRAVTKETFKLLNNAVWMPNGQYIVARKHFTSQRSVGAGEMWMYHLEGGTGVQLTKRKNDQQDVNDPTVTPDGRYLYFSEDMYPGGAFLYNKDPNDQIFVIRRYDKQTGKIENITGGGGGACRPQISRSGKLMAFVRRDGIKSCLFVRDLESAREYKVFDGLDKDQQEAWTVFGAYPGFSWMPDDKAIVLWFGGQLQKLTLPAVWGQMATATAIPMQVSVDMKLAETVRSPQAVYQDKLTAKALRQVTTSPDGKQLAFVGLGNIYLKNLPNGQPKRLTKQEQAFEFEPAYSPNGQMMAYVTWHDTIMGSVQVINLATNQVTILTDKKGVYRTPSWSPDGNSLVYRKDEGDDQMGYAYTSEPGIYLVNLNTKESKRIFEDGDNPRFTGDGKRVIVSFGGSLFGALNKGLKSHDLNGQDEKIIFTAKYASQYTPSPDGKWLAFTELHKAFICPMPLPGQAIDISGSMDALPVAGVSKYAGYNLHWSSDSKSLHWTLGDEYFTTPLNIRFAFLEGAPDSLPDLDSVGLRIGLSYNADKPQGQILLTNARIITMEGDLVIEKGDILIKDNRIVSIREEIGVVSPDMQIIDCTGKTIMPGIIDVHAHSGNFRYGLSPNKQWEYYANLAYGVTTSHDPSANSEMVFAHSEMLKSGKMLGPRLFSTGTILYGAEGDFKAPINSYEDAYGALRRTQAFGAFSVKSYNQPRRDQRQQVMAAAKALNMLVVPEGGSFFNHNMTQVVDGHTGVEHNIPVATLYDDVIEMWSRTKTHNTPTLIVCYGALNGEYYWYQNTNVWDKKRLQRYMPNTDLYSRARHVTQAPDEEYQNGHILVSKSLNKLQTAGVNINLGAHGQLQGLGAHWELWMLQQGGMSNLQSLKCATINGAVYLGMDSEIGSIKEGKLADLIVIDGNPLTDIRSTENVKYVMINGRLFDAETLKEQGNTPSLYAKTPFWFEMPGSQVNGQSASTTKGKIKCACGQ